MAPKPRSRACGSCKGAFFCRKSGELMRVSLPDERSEARWATACSFVFVSRAKVECLLFAPNLRASLESRSASATSNLVCLSCGRRSHPTRYPESPLPHPPRLPTLIPRRSPRSQP